MQSNDLMDLASKKSLKGYLTWWTICHNEEPPRDAFKMLCEFERWLRDGPVPIVPTVGTIS